MNQNDLAGRILPTVAARLMMPLLLLGVVLLVADHFLGSRALMLSGTASCLVALVLGFRPGGVRREPIEVCTPVAGRWLPIHSPANRVPSHGVHAYGQTYAVDLVHGLPDGTGPEMRLWPPARRPEAFSGFGQPVLAAAGGTVVRTHGWERDHWSRGSWPALPFVLVEGMLREFTGPSRVIGNHVVIDHGDGVYAVYAHLRRRSLRVSVGDRVEAGQQIGEVGNSGNSSEPHLHFQLMDRPGFLLAAGLPFRFTAYEVDGQVRAGVPHNWQWFRATPAGSDARNQFV